MPVCLLLYSVGMHSFTGKKQRSHSFPNEHFNQGPQGFLHWRKVPDLHGTLKHQTSLTYRCEYTVHVCLRAGFTVCTYISFNFFVDCYGVARNGFM